MAGGDVNGNQVNWTRAVAGAVIGEVGQVAATFLWVAVYSHLIHPGQPLEVYQRYAQAAGPYVSILGGAPIFYAASRWLARSVPTALGLFGVFLALDVALFAVAAEPFSWAYVGLAATSYLTKLAACYLGGRHALGRATLRSSG